MSRRGCEPSPWCEPQKKNYLKTSKGLSWNVWWWKIRNYFHFSTVFLLSCLFLFCICKIIKLYLYIVKIADLLKYIYLDLLSWRHFQKASPLALKAPRQLAGTRTLAACLLRALMRASLISFASASPKVCQISLHR